MYRIELAVIRKMLIEAEIRNATCFSDLKNHYYQGGNLLKHIFYLKSEPSTGPPSQFLLSPANKGAM